MGFKFTLLPNNYIQRIAKPIAIFAKAKIRARFVKRWCRRYV